MSAEGTGWAIVGPNNQICGPELNGKFTTLLFITEADATAALSEFEFPKGVVVRRVKVTLVQTLR